jgi:hypothetical protein
MRSSGSRPSSGIRLKKAYEVIDNHERNDWLEQLQLKIRHGINPPASPLPSRSPSPFEPADERDAREAEERPLQARLDGTGEADHILSGHMDAEDNNPARQLGYARTQYELSEIVDLPFDQAPSGAQSVAQESYAQPVYPVPFPAEWPQVYIYPFAKQPVS